MMKDDSSTTGLKTKSCFIQLKLEWKEPLPASSAKLPYPYPFSFSKQNIQAIYFEKIAHLFILHA